MRYTLTLLATAATICFGAVGAMAHEGTHDGKDIVRDRGGQYVHDSNNGCLRTKWMAKGHLDCHPDCHAAKKSVADEQRTVHFAYNKSSIDTANQHKLMALVSEFNNHHIDHISVVGYADVTGSSDYNKKLSYNRALSVKKFIESKGFSGTSDVITEGLGESHPISNCKEGKDRKTYIACLAPDRRVEIHVVGEE